jgi:hypothetical protein
MYSVEKKKKTSKKTSKKKTSKKTSKKKTSKITTIINDDNNIYLNNKQHLLLTKLQEYYDLNNNINNIIPILDGSSNISLRIIDWFVTNYSKKNNISYLVNKYQFTVYLSYKSQLKAFSKKQFDPFCRRERINFKYKKIQINTTVGQLNFFKWALENNILNYIKEHLKEIELDMYVSFQKNKNKDKTPKGERKKRQELSVSATKTVNKRNVKIIVKFD